MFRSIAAIIFGLVAWFAVAITADYLLVTQLSLPPGARFALLGVAELVFGGAAVVLALRLAGLRLASVGWTAKRAAPDLLIGLAIACAFAALQFLVIIPATGGAERSDIVANAAQIGDSPASLLGFLVLAVLGSASEELLFRGLLLGGIALAAGARPWSRVLATIVTVVLFALGHGYQGWAGVIDTGLYGGLLLSLLYWWRGARLAAPMAAHAAWNVIAAAVIFTTY